MRDLWLVAWHEYRRTVARRAFLLGTLAVPLGLAALIAVTIVIETSGESRLPIGYVDQAGLLAPGRPARVAEAEAPVEMRAFPDEAAALAALKAEAVQAVFVLPADYALTRQTDLYYLKQPPGETAWGQFDDFVRANAVAALPAAVQTRLLAGPRITVVDVASGRTFSEQGLINIILPVAAGFLFFLTTASASGYLLRVVADEKENRTMEVMLTSLTPAQLIAGKTLGLLGAVLTQLAVYATAVVIGLAVAGRYVPELRQAVAPWDYLGVMALFFLPTFGLLTAVMVAIGAAMPDVQQGQQIVGLVNLAFLAPVFLLALIFENPGHPAVIALTLFPTSAFLTIALRWGLGVVPLWQLGVSWLLLVSATLLIAWGAARLFRVGMLRYGQPLSMRAVWAGLRGK